MGDAFSAGDGVVLTFDVVSNPVEQLLMMLEDALSPASFTEWLTGPAHAYWVNVEVDRFGHMYDGDTAWQPLSPTTQKIRRSAGYGADQPINIRTGEMFRAITENFDIIDGGTGGVAMLMPGKSIDPMTAKKIQTAQQGNPTNAIEGFGGTPARPVMKWEPSNAQELLELLAVHIVSFVQGGSIGQLGDFVP